MSAYNGKEKYLFVSYAHKDAGIVLPLIDGLVARGVQLWYDEGIEVGTEWAEFIEERILGCEALVLFLSRASIESINCREEFALAREASKKILICYLEELAPSELKHGLRLRVPSYQCVFLTRHPNAVSLLDEICRARILEGCIGLPTDTAAVSKSDVPPKAESPMERDARLLELQRVDSTPAPRATPTTSASEPAPSIPKPAPSVTPTPAPAVFAPSSPPSVTPTPRPAKTASEAAEKPEPEVKYSEGLDIRGDVLFGIGACTDERIVVPRHVKLIAARAFKGQRRIKEVLLPEGVTEIGDGAFAGCVALSSCRIPESVKKIGRKAFYKCESYCFIDVNCEEVGAFAFYGALHLRIYVGTNVKSIGRRAFDSGNLADDLYGETIEYRGDYYDWRLIKRHGLRLGKYNWVLCADGSAYLNGKYMHNEKSIYTEPAPRPAGIKDSVGLDIRNNTLYGIGTCTDERVVVPFGVRAIAENAFKNCKQLKHITLHEHITAIPDGAFCGCTSLETVNYGFGSENVIKRIGDKAFYGCEFLYFPHPTQAEQIGKKAFYGLRYGFHGFLTTRVREIGRLAFGKSKYNRAITYEGSIAQWKRVETSSKIISARTQRVCCTDGDYTF